MSADCSTPATTQSPTQVCMAPTLSTVEQTLISSLLSLLPPECIGEAQTATGTLTIKGLVDGRGLACPMPLLKTKVALREVNAGESLYIVATDANSQADIAAFCQQSKRIDAANSLSLFIHQATTNSATAQAHDTIFHFIITKTARN